MKVLIVDDNKQIISILEAYAKKEGYQTVIAVDGQEALDVFQRERPDIILLDVMMPKIDGFGGGPSGVAESLMSSSGDVTFLLVDLKGSWDWKSVMV